MTILFLFLLLIIFLWPKSQDFPIKYYLPVNTGFYLHLKQVDWLLGDQNNQEFIDNKAIFDLWQRQKQLWGPYYINIEELVWFKVEQNFNDDAYLLRFSTLPDKDYFKELKKTFPDYNFYKLDKNILLVSSSLKDDIIFKKEILSAEDIYFPSEAIIYFQKDKIPDFLLGLSETINLHNGQDIFLGIDKSKRQINFLSAILESQRNNENDFSGLILPQYLDLGFGFSSPLLREHKKAISSSLLANNFLSLPQNILGAEYKEGAMLEKKAIFEQGDNWLLVSLEDFDQDILQFLNVFKAKEVHKTLVDGTSYYELLADNEQDYSEYELTGVKYRQIGDLYALKHGNYHYLSNSEDFIKDIITKSSKISDLLLCGDSNNKEITDFVFINDDKSLDGVSKDYLSSKGVTNFRAFSYKTDNFEGVTLCY